MRTIVWIAAVLATIGPGRPLPGQQRQARDPALVAYVRDVLARNGSLTAAGLDLAGATERIGPAGALPDPTIGLGVMALPVPSFAFAREPMTQLPIRVEQRFPFRGQRGAATAVARADSSAAAADSGLTASRLAAEAAIAWFELAFAREARGIAQSRAALADRAVLTAQTRYETGAAPQTDVLRARLRRAEAADEERRLEAAVIAAAGRADALRGGRTDSVLTTLTPPTSTDPSPDVLSEATSPELVVIRAQVERARRQAEAFAIAGRPDFTVSVQNGVRFGGREPFLTALVGVSVPLWAGRKQEPLARAAARDAEAALSRYEDGRARLVGRLQAESAQLTSLRERLSLSAEQIVPLAEAASTSALQRYQVGAVEFSAVLDTEDDAYRARLSQARLLADYGVARARLAALTGEEWYR